MANHTEKSQQSATFSTDEQRARRKIAREVAAMWDDIARAAGFEPIERRTAWAIAVRLYEHKGQAPDTPCRISLAAIGSALTSRSDEEKARGDTARNRVGHLFNHAIPRTGFQILTRYKAEEESGRPHEYSDHLTPIAAFFSELLDEEIKSILASKGLDKKAKREKIEETRARLVVEALDYLPKCEAELITPEGETYAFMSEPEAKAYSARHQGFAVRPYQYTPPASEDLRKRPFYDQDLKRIEERIKATIESQLDEILERNSFDEARLFSMRVEQGIHKAIASWRKVACAQPCIEKRDIGINIMSSNFEGSPPADESSEPAENLTDTLWKTDSETEAQTPPNFGGVIPNNSLDINTCENDSLETEPVENSPELAIETYSLEPAREMSGSVNFDTSLDAGLFYARDGWHVLPICNFNPEVGRCTAKWHAETCTGKAPLVKGSGQPGYGYTAATRDLAKIRHWWGREFPDAGVGIRLDGHVLIDADLKDNGPESYAFIHDTYGLPETLTAITQGGGNHFVFRLLPESEELLKSWTRVLDKIELPGIDLKVGKRGLLYAEPTRGKKGVYRWVDPTVAPAILPHEVAEFFNTIRHKDDRQAVEKAETNVRRSTLHRSAPFDPDQSKYFRDVPRGERHPRLRDVARACRAAGANAAQIEAALNYHASRFSDPLYDPAYIARVARECEMKFSPEVSL